MVDRAKTVLQETLASLVAEQIETQKKIKAVRSALVAIGGSSPNLTARRKRRPMNTAERKSVSRRMKAYWAKRRLRKA